MKRRYKFLTYVQNKITINIKGNLGLECKQVYNSGMKEHFRQYYNIMDYLILVFYLASYSLRFSIFYKYVSHRAFLYLF